MSAFGDLPPIHSKSGEGFFGEGVPQDYVAAHMWFNLAATHATDSETRDGAANGREVVLGLMTPAQIAEAQKPAREWVCGLRLRTNKQTQCQLKDLGGHPNRFAGCAVISTCGSIPPSRS